MTGEAHPLTADLRAHRLTVTGKRGLFMKPLVFRPNPAPFHGESLLGLVARAVNRNSFTGLQKVISFADIVIKTPEPLPTIDLSGAKRLAFVLKVPVDEIVSRIHPSISFKDRTGEFIDFFGVPLRTLYREKCRRRVSPRALAISPHHRAIHDLRPFSFCPETMETLIDSCPVCCKTLRWFTTRGVEFCEHCLDKEGNATVDLREFPQPLVQVDDEAALRFVTDLVHPDETIRARALRSTEPALAAFGPGDLFELVIRLAQAVATPPSWHRRNGDSRQLKRVEDFAFLTPQLLARIGRVVMEWTSQFPSLADSMRADAGARPGWFGVNKELGALCLVPGYQTLSMRLRDFVKASIEADLVRTAALPIVPRPRAIRHREDLIDSLTAAKRLGVSGKVVARLANRDDLSVLRTDGRRTMVLYCASEIEAIGAVRRDMIDAPKAAYLIGLPVAALEALADAGEIERATGPALALVSGRLHYRQSSLVKLSATVGRARQRSHRPLGFRRLSAALRRLPPGEKPWVSIIRAITDGHLPTFRSKAQKGQFSSLFVKDQALLEVVRGASRPAESVNPAERLSYREAAIVIGMSEPNVSWLVSAGLIVTVGDHDRRITREALMRFNEQYMSTSEVAGRLRIHPSQLRRRLAERSIVPVCALRAGMRLIWRRADVVRYED